MPAEMPLKRASSNGSGAPFSQNESGRIVAGDSSRPSIVVTLPPAVRITMNPPPPMPQEYGSVTPSTPAAATAASTALPPSRRAWIAARVPSMSTDAAAPPLPTTVGCFWSWASAVGGSRTTSATSATMSRRAKRERRAISIARWLPGTGRPYTRPITERPSRTRRAPRARAPSWRRPPAAGRAVAA